ncbi:sugar lactone lactonase YvrE [Prauserella shujinwangii]|uniref:Sugar lactone lactonase YvrE n=1 Tax=Prauserella shujinwangii TaxID=1453103 RepID=A0A2T0LTS5_9PSEU|nr:SMP-30/gluconolactonase/LRE family protein [Prauserella shujinwangii]PRX47125.1 sugar lactone lactonase YvrE [Prauserella shujinwangii]
MRFGAVRLVPVNGHGPEDTLVDAEGRVYTGLADGRVLRIADEGRRIDTIADTGGRPLGLEFHGDELLVCDAHRGLLVVDPADGAVRTLLAEVAGRPMLFCNNAAVAADGTVYFSDSSTRFPITRWRDDLIEQTGTGRLFRRSPDGTVDEIAGGLQFANGVALAADESFVTVAETGDCRVRRVWLSGERAGTTDVFADGLAGFPDNTSTGSDGLIWVTQASPKVAALDRVRRLPAPARAGIRRLPTWLQPSPSRTCGVLAFDSAGTVVHALSGEIEGFHMLTGVRERDGRLYFGSLEERAIAITAVPG